MNPRINRYIKRRLRNRTVITVICTAVVISLAAGVLYYTKLRKNLFSKNIYPGNNSPLARTTDSSESLIYGVDFSGLLDTYLPKALEDLNRIYPDTDEAVYTEGIKLIDAYRSEIYTILKYDDWAAEIDRLTAYICEANALPVPEFKERLAASLRLVLRAADINVSPVCQLPEYPNGCEAASAVSLLNTVGVKISLKDFVDSCLPKADVHISFGCMFGPDPKKFYAGNPDAGKGGWGCYAPVIVKAIEALPDGIPGNRRAVDLSGTEFDGITNLLCLGIPVAIWVTTDFGPISGYYQWQSEDKTETFIYPANQHCVVLCGVTPDFDEGYIRYTCLDPLTGKTVCVPAKKLSGCFESMGKQAVALIPDGLNVGFAVSQKYGNMSLTSIDIGDRYPADLYDDKINN